LLETEFETLSFEKTIELFEKWGFLVQQGPRTAEVTIILEGPCHRSYYVCEPKQVSDMAAVILRQRLQIRAMRCPILEVQ
jgi:hypothetical protein